MEISLIWAMARNGVIGRANGLPWRLPEDMAFFVATTMGKPVIMGRKTFETMKTPLAGRTNVIVTRNADYAAKGIFVARGLEEALEISRRQCQVDGGDEIMIAGGAEIYRASLDRATRLYVTRIDADLEGDTVFPELDWTIWRQIKCEEFLADESHDYPFSICTFERG